MFVLFFNKMSFISQIYVTWFMKYLHFSKSMQKIEMPTQKNLASWDLQLGFNLAFKRLRTMRPMYRTDIPLPSRCCILYIFFNKYKY